MISLQFPCFVIHPSFKAFLISLPVGSFIVGALLFLERVPPLVVGNWNELIAKALSKNLFLGQFELSPEKPQF